MLLLGDKINKLSCVLNKIFDVKNNTIKRNNQGRAKTVVNEYS